MLSGICIEIFWFLNFRFNSTLFLFFFHKWHWLSCQPHMWFKYSLVLSFKNDITKLYIRNRILLWSCHQYLLWSRYLVFSRCCKDSSWLYKKRLILWVWCLVGAKIIVILNVKILSSIIFSLKAWLSELLRGCFDKRIANKSSIIVNSCWSYRFGKLKRLDMLY